LCATLKLFFKNNFILTWNHGLTTTDSHKQYLREVPAKPYSWKMTPTKLPNHMILPIV